MQPWQLSELTHREPPWRQARAKAGLSEGERGNAVITHQSMRSYPLKTRSRDIPPAKIIP